ncbi:MAG: hypothetical protein AAGF94_12485 [Pseudomonadota bacterium]
MSALKTIVIAAGFAAGGAAASLEHDVLSSIVDSEIVEPHDGQTTRYVHQPSENRLQLGRYEGSFWAQFRPDALPVLLAGFRNSN